MFFHHKYLLLLLLLLSLGSYGVEDPNKNVPPDLISDYQKWFKTTKSGDVIEWGGGKLTRLESGARFIDAIGMVTLLPEENVDYNKLALKNPNIARQWATQYGFKPIAATPVITPVASPVASSVLVPLAPFAQNLETNRVRATGSNNIDFITKQTESAMDMLALATRRYKEGTISKEQFLAISNQVSKMINYDGSVESQIKAQTSNPSFQVVRKIEKKFREKKISKNEYINSLMDIGENQGVQKLENKVAASAAAPAVPVKIPFVENLNPDITSSVVIDSSAQSLKYYEGKDQLGSPKLFQFNNTFFLSSQTYGSSLLLTSLDGVNWSKRAVVDSFGRPLFVKNLIWDGKRICGLGQQLPGTYGQGRVSDTKTFFVSSVDGKKWVSEHTDIPVVTYIQPGDGALFIRNSQEIAWNGKLFVTVQPDELNESTVFTSTDGLKWEHIGKLPKLNPENKEIDIFSTFVNSIGSQFIITKASGAAEIVSWTSSTGSDWAIHSTKTDYFGVMGSKVVNGQLFILANNYGQIFRTNNGIDWIIGTLGTDNLEIVPTAVPEKLKADYANYFNTTKDGDVMDWAGGKLYRMRDRARFVGPNGRESFMPNWKVLTDDDFNSMASSDANIAGMWASQYGYKPESNKSAKPKAMAMRDIGYNGSFYLVLIGEIGFGYKSTDGSNWSRYSLPDTGRDASYNELTGTAWSAITSSGNQMVLTGMDAGSVLLKPGFATNATINKAIDLNTSSNGNTGVSNAAADNSIKACDSNPNYPICAPKEKRLQALRELIFNSAKPVSMSELGPGFEGSESVFDKDLIYDYKTFVVSCQVAAEKYGLFGGAKNTPGHWTNEQDFTDTNNKFVGRGGAFMGERNYFDRKSGVIRITPDISFLKVGNCIYKSN